MGWLPQCYLRQAMSGLDWKGGAAAMYGFGRLHQAVYEQQFLSYGFLRVTFEEYTSLS